MPSNNQTISPTGNMSIRTGTITSKNINNPIMLITYNAIQQIFTIGPGGTVTGLNPLFITQLVTTLTPIITTNVIKDLCAQGCIDPYCCYYTDNCCGDNNVKNLNKNLKNFLNSSNNNTNNGDNDFSLLSTEIFEDTASIKDNIDQIQSIESNQFN